MRGKTRIRTAALGAALATMTALGAVGASSAVAAGPAVERVAGVSGESTVMATWVRMGSYSTFSRCANAGHKYVLDGYASQYRCDSDRPGYALFVLR